MTTRTAVGVDQTMWAKSETTYDTVIDYAAGDQVCLTELKIDPSKDFEKSDEHCGTASLQDEIAGLEGGTWSAVSYFKPNAVGVAPDVGAMLAAAFGTETVSGGVSVTYALNEADNPKSLQLSRQAGDGLFEQVNGAWVESVEIESTGNSAGKITFSGGFATYSHAFGGTLGAIMAGAATTATLTTGHGGRFRKNALVKFGTDDNSGAGYRITSVDNTAETFVFTPGAAVGAASGDAVVGLHITGSTSGTILGSIANDMSIGGSSVGVISTKISFATGIHGLDKESGAGKANRLSRGKREISGESQVYFLDDETGTHLGLAWDGATTAIVQRIGANTAALRVTHTILKARIEVVPIEIPDSDEATTMIRWVARQSSAAGDEYSMLWS